METSSWITMILIMGFIWGGFAYLLALYQVPEQLTTLLLAISENPIVILIILNLMLLALGMIMDMAALILISSLAVVLMRNTVQAAENLTR